MLGMSLSRRVKKTVDIEHILLTQSHFAHIRDLPLIIENYYEKREKTLKIYGLSSTLEVLKNHLFNDIIWPKFHARLEAYETLRKEGKIPATYEVVHGHAWAAQEVMKGPNRNKSRHIAISLEPFAKQTNQI